METAALYIAAFGFIGGLLAMVWASVKVGYERVKQKPFPKNDFTDAMDILLFVVPNLPGALHSALKVQGSRLFMSQNTARNATFSINAQMDQGFDPDQVAKSFAEELERKTPTNEQRHL
jgi:hypothetical protein